MPDEREFEQLRQAVRGMMLFQSELAQRMIAQGALNKEDVAFAISNSSAHFPPAGELQELWGNLQRAMLR
jgi:hypothetical protein